VHVLLRMFQWSSVNTVNVWASVIQIVNLTEHFYNCLRTKGFKCLLYSDGVEESVKSCIPSDMLAYKMCLLYAFYLNYLTLHGFLNDLPFPTNI